MLVALGLAIVAVAALIMFYSPFAGLLVYWAWFLVRPQEFLIGLGGTFPLERMLILALAVSFLMHTKVFGHRPWEVHRVGLALLGFLAVNYLSIVTSVWASETLQTANDLGKVVVFVFLIINLVDDSARLRQFLWVYVLCIGWNAGDSIYLYYTDPYYAQGIQRATSATLTWGDPNATAINLALSLAVTMALFQGEKGWLRRGTLMVLGVASLACIALTGSRSGVLVTSILLAFIALRSSRRLFLIPATVCVLMLAWAIIPEEYQQRYAGIFQFLGNPKAGRLDDDSATQSAYGRIVGWEVAVQMFVDRPVLGVGAGCFPAAFGGSQFHYSFEGRKGWSQPHNLPGQLISELGLMGVLSFGWFVGVMLATYLSIRRSLREMPNPPPLLESLNFAVLLMLIGLFLAGFAGHNLYRYNWYVAAALLIITQRLTAREVAGQKAAQKEAVLTENESEEALGAIPHLERV